MLSRAGIRVGKSSDIGSSAAEVVRPGTYAGPVASLLAAAGRNQRPQPLVTSVDTALSRSLEDRGG